MICPMPISLCTSTIETAVYENRTHGGVRGRELVAPSYSIIQREHILTGEFSKRALPREVCSSKTQRGVREAGCIADSIWGTS